jgi:hypothetical protein
MKKTIYLLLFSSLFLLFVTQCRSKQEKQLVGIWKLEVMEINGTEISGASLGEWLWEFNDEGGYLVMVAGAKEKGKFNVRAGKLTMKSVTIKDRPETSYEITQLDSASLKLKAISDKNSSSLTFIKINKGETEEED